MAYIEGIIVQFQRMTKLLKILINKEVLMLFASSLSISARMLKTSGGTENLIKKRYNNVIT